MNNLNFSFSFHFSFTLNMHFETNKVVKLLHKPAVFYSNIIANVVLSSLLHAPENHMQITHEF